MSSCASLTVPSRPLATRAGSGRTASTSTSTSTPTSTWRRPFGRRGNAALQPCRAGGSHFDRLIKKQGGAYDSSLKQNEEEAALDAFWLSRGVKEEAYRSRLVGMGAALASSVSARGGGGGKGRGRATSIDVTSLFFPFTHTTSFSYKSSMTCAVLTACFKELTNPSPQERELYRNPDRLGHSLDRLQTLFPDINVAEMMWKEPAVLRLPLKHVGGAG
jgi:hypothetical protein